MRRNRYFFAATGLILLSQLLTVTGQAQTPGVTFSETSSSVYNVPNLTRGYTFNVNQPFAISALGMFDSGQDGFVSTHIVSLWDSSGSLLASVNMPAGTSAELINQFRYMPITPVNLSLGNYTVGVYYPTLTPQQGLGDAMMTGISDASTDPEFTILNYTFAHPGYWDPAPYLADHENFGANFLIIPIPEPSTVALIGLGAAAVIARRCFSSRP